MVMFGIITTAGYNLFREQGRIGRSQQNILEMQSNGRAALHFLTQSFSHAGFGCSETEPEFLIFINGASNAPDNATVRYGYRVIGEVSTNSSGTATIPVQSGHSISSGNTVCFYPSITPNISYIVNSSGGTSITLNKEVGIVAGGAKIFQVSDLEYYVSNNILWQKDSIGTEAIASDVVSFQIAYSRENPTNWVQTSGGVDNPKSIYLFLVLRTREREAGITPTSSFILPWNNNTLMIDAENGYSYQGFQTQVWVRNAD